MQMKVCLCFDMPVELNTNINLSFCFGCNRMQNVNAGLQSFSLF